MSGPNTEYTLSAFTSEEWAKAFETTLSNFGPDPRNRQSFYALLDKGLTPILKLRNIQERMKSMRELVGKDLDESAMLTAINGGTFPRGAAELEECRAYYAEHFLPKAKKVDGRTNSHKKGVWTGGGYFSPLLKQVVGRSIEHHEFNKFREEFRKLGYKFPSPSAWKDEDKEVLGRRFWEAANKAGLV